MWYVRALWMLYREQVRGWRFKRQDSDERKWKTADENIAKCVCRSRFVSWSDRIVSDSVCPSVC